MFELVFDLVFVHCISSSGMTTRLPEMMVLSARRGADALSGRPSISPSSFTMNTNGGGSEVSTSVTPNGHISDPQGNHAALISSM